MTFLRSLSGLWLLVRQFYGISAGSDRHQIKWERSPFGISAILEWLPVVRRGCMIGGISACFR